MEYNHKLLSLVFDAIDQLRNNIEIVANTCDIGVGDALTQINVILDIIKNINPYDLTEEEYKKELSLIELANE